MNYGLTQLDGGMVIIGHRICPVITKKSPEVRNIRNYSYFEVMK